MTNALVIPDIHPSIKPVRAIVTTRWGTSGYRPLVIRSIENYYVDTALDNDADTWTVDIGDPHGEFLELMNRDSEVRCQLFGAGREGSTYLVTGMADEISYDEQGTVSLTGRDMSALAVDSFVPPQKFQHVRAWSIVDQQAKQIGFRETNLSKNPMVKKVQHTDGSESYWEFWYRLYRKEQMWLWTEPTGVLTAQRLNYQQPISYFFGTPDKSDSAALKNLYIPIDSAQMRRSTQQRVWEVWVYGHKGDNGFRVISRDPTLNNWIKRPRKFLLDTESHTPKGAQKLGWEEIFEGKVGSMEVKVTIPDPGFAVRQNKVAHVRLPEIGFEGDFFIVGVRVQGGPEGMLQEIRMRQKQYALTRRIPKDPTITTSSEEPHRTQVKSDLGTAVSQLPPDGMPESWGQYFVNAANKWHGPWDYTLFLATLLAICDQETSFFNERANGGPGGDHIEWYPWDKNISADHSVSSDFIGPPAPGQVVTQNGQVIRDSHGRTREQYEEIFANEPGRYIGNATYAVGPMQLYSQGYKNWADDAFKPGNRDQYAGGRWSPEWNIWAGARALRDKLQSSVGDSGRDIDMWSGVSHYGNHAAGEGPDVVPTKYALSVKNKVYNDPGYILGVKSSLKAAREAADAAKDGMTESPTATGTSDTKGLPTRNEILAAFSSPFVGSSLFQSKADTMRQRIVMAAMWGYYNEAEVHYVSTNTNPQHLGQRMKDFQPPPNVPEWTDCSGYATWCYFAADAPDPNGNDYNGTGYTGTLWNHGKSISFAELKPGDLVFYGSPLDPNNAHVAVYVGQGKVISHGSENGPILRGVYDRSDVAGFRSYIN